MSTGLAVDSFLERDVLVRGAGGSCWVFSRRRRGLFFLGPLVCLDEDNVLKCSARRGVGSGDGGAVVMLPWGWLVVGSNGRPPVSLGSDMFDEGGDGVVYI